MHPIAQNATKRIQGISIFSEDRPGSLILEIGDCYVLTFDRSLLALDHFLFNDLTSADFHFLFPTQTVLLKLQAAKELEVTADHNNLALVKKGLNKWSSILTDQLTLRVAGFEPLTYELICEPEVASRNAAPDDSMAPHMVQPGWHAVLESLRQAKYAAQEAFAFHEEACHLSLCQPLDKLISLSYLPDFVPYPHQVQAVKAVISKFRGRALLCDEVGLGKTIEACLVLLEYLQRDLVKSVLILSPPSLTGQWQEELRKKFGLDFVINDEERFGGWDKHQFVVASLATAKLSPNREALSAREFDLVIVDEAHHLRNRATKAWQLVSGLKKRYIMLLTATPMQNGLSDIYSLVTLLKPGHLKTYGEFRQQFVTKGEEFKPKNLDQLRGLLQGVMVRNKRSHTNIILSKRFARTIELDLHPQEAAYYDRITALVRRGAMHSTAGGKTIVDAFTLQLLQLEAGSSVPATLPLLAKLSLRDLPASYLAEVLSILAAGRSLAETYSAFSRKASALLDILRGFGDKVIVFTRFQETLIFLQQYLNRNSVSTAVFHGGMLRSEKEAAIQRFKDESSCQVLISSESGGEGRNLQFCHGLVNYDLPWNPMKIEQRIGRIHRLGQEKDVQIFNLAARNTAESYVLELLDKKINLFELVVGEVDMILGNLEEEKDFEEMIFNIWTQSSNDVEVARRLEELGRKLADAKAQYLRSQEFDDRVFGDALLTS